MSEREQTTEDDGRIGSNVEKQIGCGGQRQKNVPGGYGQQQTIDHKLGYQTWPKHVFSPSVEERIGDRRNKNRNADREN